MWNFMKVISLDRVVIIYDFMHIVYVFVHIYYIYAYICLYSNSDTPIGFFSSANSGISWNKNFKMRDKLFNISISGYKIRDIHIT